jgi:hypothetical protein
MASTVFVFYREEPWLGGLIIPAVAVGIAYVIVGPALLVGAVGAVVGCVTVAFAVALRTGLRAGAGRTVSPIGGPRGLVHGRIGRTAGVMAYNALAAAFLLHAQVPYLLNRFDVVIAGLPLFVTMGMVEWRARRFTDESRRLLSRVRYPQDFGRRVWLMLTANVVACWAVTGTAAAVLLVILYQIGRLTPAGIEMAAAQTTLAGAYLVAFVVASHERYASLCVALAVALAAHLVAPQLLTAVSGVAYSDTLLYLASALLLLLLFMVGLIPVLGQVWRYR